MRRRIRSPRHRRRPLQAGWRRFAAAWADHRSRTGDFLALPKPGIRRR